ncbi:MULTISPECIES: cation:proton antiporter family protein [Spongiibacter]|uniref:cation:proton antiporter family protein n=1 Tax=Spongiibacter TaxID=630749 RepID=UPI0003B414A5|nr:MULTISPECIES: cation:proton antiporter family protein [Spongiibacter]MBO6753853.1 cation:proton antiporter [Spongiibacter sp.]
MIEPLLLALAFLAGLIFRRMDMPPLLGFLLAGFMAGALELGDRDVINQLADIGVVLLLFTIGLKLKIRELLAPQIWATASLHALLVVPLTTLVLLSLHFLLPKYTALPTETAWVLAFALSFSSTVFAVKIFEQRGEGAALHAQIAIGILIVQDIMAVAFLLFSSGDWPSPWALMLVALPLLRRPLLKLLDMAGHGELLVLYGLAMALASAWLFEALHLKAGLGALVFGVLLANSDKSVELYKGLLTLKDIFLTAFFLSIGYYGLPDAGMLALALLLAILVLLRPIIYFGLLMLFRLRARTGLLAGLSLSNYSEFGLIVAALAVKEGLLPEQWLTILAVSMAMSLFISAPLNKLAHQFYGRHGARLQGFERQQLLAAEQGVDLGDAEIVIFGMGRIGGGAYEYLSQHYPGRIMGIEESAEKAAQLQREGMRCVAGDASDRDFLERAELSRRRLLLVCLSNHSENVRVVSMLQSLGYRGDIAVISRFADQQRELRDMGCISFNLYAEAGHGFAERVLDALDDTPEGANAVA